MTPNDDRALAEAAGYQATPDVGKADFWTWNNRMTGEECASSFASEDEAWTDALRETASATMGSMNISDETWDGASQDQKLAWISHAFMPAPKFC